MSDSGYLLGLAIGPVQPFIEAARRTRDLWYGSYILSEVAKAAAKSLHIADAKLVFPAPKNLDELNSENFTVANRVIAFIPAADLEKARALLCDAKAAAITQWENMAQAAKDAFEKIDKGAAKPSEIDGERWTEQVGDVLELYAACKHVNDVNNESDFAAARDRLDELLAARKNTRDFFRIGKDVPMGIAKSALDGARESVIEPKSLSSKVLRYMGINDNEALDAIGLVKRVGGRAERFTPLTRVAANAWLERLPADKWQLLKRGYQTLVDAELGRRVGGYSDFAFDCQLLYKGQLEKELADHEKGKGTAGALAALTDFHKTIKQVWKDHGMPSTYVALLMADGDHMGKLIDEAAKTLETQRNISRALAGFAAQVSAIVSDKKHNGQAVYAGGDDVLAIVPVESAVACAQELAETFATSLASFGGGTVQATLSVGIAIRHVFDPLGTLRRDAARALKIAKDGIANDRDQGTERNALGIVMVPRSGAEIVVRGRWQEDIAELKPLATRLDDWKESFIHKKLSSKAAYDLREVAQILSREPKLSRLEALRVLAHKRDGKADLDDALASQLGAVIERRSVQILVNELLIARRIAGLES